MLMQIRKDLDRMARNSKEMSRLTLVFGRCAAGKRTHEQQNTVLAAKPAWR